MYRFKVRLLSYMWIWLSQSESFEAGKRREFPCQKQEQQLACNCGARCADTFIWSVSSQFILSEFPDWQANNTLASPSQSSIGHGSIQWAVAYWVSYRKLGILIKCLSVRVKKSDKPVRECTALPTLSLYGNLNAYDKCTRVQQLCCDWLVYFLFKCMALNSFAEPIAHCLFESFSPKASELVLFLAWHPFCVEKKMVFTRFTLFNCKCSLLFICTYWRCNAISVFSSLGEKKNVFLLLFFGAFSLSSMIQVKLKQAEGMKVEFKKKKKK